MAGTLERAAQAGASSVRDCSLESFAHAFSGHHVVTLVAHSQGEEAQAQVEMADGFVPVTSFVQRIPADFAGVLDLTSCRSRHRLLEAVKRRAPWVTVVVSERNVGLIAPMLQYRATLSVLSVRAAYYTTVLADIAVAVRRDKNMLSDRIRRVISAILPDVVLGPSTRALDQEERRALLAELERVDRSTSPLVALAVALLTILFFTALATSLAAGFSKLLVGGIVSGLGLSAAGCIAWLVRLWQTKTATTLLLTLAVSLEGEALAAAVRALYAQSTGSKLVDPPST